MRDTIVGLVLALLLLAGLFALPRFSSHEELQTTPAQVAAKIEPGFSGVRRIGPWIFTCRPVRNKAVPLPFSFGARKSGASAGIGAADLGRCRAFIAFHPKADPKRVSLLVNFRVLGRVQRLATFVRIPPGAKKGDLVALRLGQKVLRLPVSACEQGSCLVVAALNPKEEALLYTLRFVELVLPPDPNGKSLEARVPLLGLRAAIGAMRRSQVGE